MILSMGFLDKLSVRKKPTESKESWPIFFSMLYSDIFSLSALVGATL